MALTRPSPHPQPNSTRAECNNITVTITMTSCGAKWNIAYVQVNQKQTKEGHREINAFEH